MLSYGLQIQANVVGNVIADVDAIVVSEVFITILLYYFVDCCSHHVGTKVYIVAKEMQ